MKRLILLSKTMTNQTSEASICNSKYRLLKSSLAINLARRQVTITSHSNLPKAYFDSLGNPSEASPRTVTITTFEIM